MLWNKTKLDVSQIALEKCANDNILCIPYRCHNRSSLLTDPIHGIPKLIIICM